MKINNKEFGEWTEDDLQVLLSNDAYRENNFIDYKVIHLLWNRRNFWSSQYISRYFDS